MNKVVISCVLLMSGFAATAQNGKETLKGEIMDTQCAMVGSHEMMKKQLGAQDDAECTRACVKQGGKLVLYDSTTKKVYQLNDQQKAMTYAGQKVRVIGIPNDDANSIQIETIQPVSE